jgi:hypothetical protein
MTRARGFSLVELLVSLAGALAAVAVVAALAVAARRVQAVAPDASDMQQRMRVSATAVVALLLRAGAAPAGDASASALSRSLPPLFPHRRGPAGPDPELSAYPDRLSVVRITEAAAAAPLAAAMATPASTLQLSTSGGCTGATACRFALGDRVVVADDTGTFDLFTISGLGLDTLDHMPALLVRPFTPAISARVGAARVEALAWDPAAAMLRSYVDASGGQPLVDDVVGFSVRYFADTAPPLQPRPPSGVSSCLFDAAGLPLLPVLPATYGPLAELTPAMLTDGPVCGLAPQRFDADLYRLRQVRVTLRVQASSPARRGRDPRKYVHPGIADESQAWPDAELTLDVTIGARRSL